MKSYILYEIEEKQGKLNQSTIYVFHWLDKDTLEKYETIVDTSYKNFTRCGWEQIIKSSNPYGEYGQLRVAIKKTNKGKKVIDADSLPKKYDHLTIDQITDFVEKKLKEQNNANNFDELFSVL